MQSPRKVYFVVNELVVYSFEKDPFLYWNLQRSRIRDGFLENCFSQVLVLIVLAPVDLNCGVLHRDWLTCSVAWLTILEVLKLSYVLTDYSSEPAVWISELTIFEGWDGLKWNQFGVLWISSLNLRTKDFRGVRWVKMKPVRGSLVESCPPRLCKNDHMSRCTSFDDCLILKHAFNQEE